MSHKKILSFVDVPQANVNLNRFSFPDYVLLPPRFLLSMRAYSDLLAVSEVLYLEQRSENIKPVDVAVKYRRYKWYIDQQCS